MRLLVKYMRIQMKFILTAFGLILIVSLGSARAGAPQAEVISGPLLIAGNAPEPGCVAQLNDSSCRPGKFPLHNPDPAIPGEPANKKEGKTAQPPEIKSGLKSQDCQFGLQKCYCTNRMAVSKAGRLGIREIRSFGYPLHVLINGKKRGRNVELIISRESSCPVISNK
jgi:hypothetical protein